MQEHIQVNSAHEQLLQAAQEVGWLALSEVAVKYGDGSQTNRLIGIDANLAFHHLGHSMGVANGADRVAQALGLNTMNRAIVNMAAKAHDVMQLGKRGEIEAASAEWLAREMRRVGFGETAVHAGRLAVLGTEPIFGTDPVMIQRAILQPYESVQEQQIAESVACGDMSQLYSSVGILTSRDLYKELNGASAIDTPSLDGLLDFQKGQLALMYDYQFPNPVGETLFGQQRAQTIKHHEDVLDRLSHGMIETWQELLGYDAAFVQSHA